MTFWRIDVIVGFESSGRSLLLYLWVRIIKRPILTEQQIVRVFK